MRKQKCKPTVVEEEGVCLWQQWRWTQIWLWDFQNVLVGMNGAGAEGLCKIRLIIRQKGET